MPSVVTDVVRRIWTEQVAIDVQPDEVEMVLVQTKDKEAEEYFGKIEFRLAPEVARALGQAMIDCANELEKK